jgi:hypothetical protein
VDAGNVNGNGSGLSAITGANVTGQVGNALVAGTVYTNAQPNITSVGTLSSLSVTGNITAGNVNGNGSGLSAITGANVTGQVGNALVSGTVYTAAQPNITSVGTLSSLSVTGNIAGNFFIGNGSQLTGVAASQLANGTKTFDLAANGIVSMPTSASFFDSNQQYLVDTAHVLDEFDITQYRTAKYIVQATRINEGNSTSQVHSTEVLLTHNGVNTFMTEYATLITSNALITLDSYIANGNAVLEATTLAVDTTVDLFRVTLVPGPM